MLLTPTPPHGSRTNIGVIEPGDQGTNIKICLDIKSRVIFNSAHVSELTIKFLSERVGSIQQDVGFRVNSLQLFQRGLPPTDTLRTNTHTDATLVCRLQLNSTLIVERFLLLHTSHCALSPVSCSRDQMLWIRPACSGWLLVFPHMHWCFCISESYTRPERTQTGTIYQFAFVLYSCKLCFKGVSGSLQIVRKKQLITAQHSDVT